MHPKHRSFRGHRSRRGFALVDVIIGGVLLGVGLAAVISMTTRALRTQTDGEKQLIASWIADEYLSMVLVEGPVNYRKMYDVSGQCEPPFDEFDYDIAIEDLGIGVPMRITASIRWLGAGGVRQVQVQTLLADRGVEPNGPRAPYEAVDRINRWYDIYEEQEQ